MNTDHFEATIKRVLEIARYAPSINNVQSWSATLDNGTLKLSIDPQHSLTFGDPTGRQTTISLGIFSEAVYEVALEQGLTIRRLDFKDQTVSISFVDTTTKMHGESSVAALLKSRCSDRSVYQQTTLSPSTIRSIKSVKNLPATAVWVSTEQHLIHKVATLSSHAIGVALSSFDFRNELAQYMILPWSHKKRGIVLSSLYLPKLISIIAPFMLRMGFGSNSQRTHERQCWLSASAVIFITAEGDMPRYWFDAGRTYLRVSLAVEKLGLSQATSAAIVEASNYHEDIEELLHTDQRILAVLRIGKGSVVRHHSPRVGVDELLH